MTAQFSLNREVQDISEKPSMLIDELRDERGLVGTKAACREGDCGSCQVLIKFPNKHSWSSYTSCLLRLQDLTGAHVLTIEALPKSSPLIEILSAAGVSQCGFCSPGLVISLIHWLLNGDTLTQEEGIKAINSNLCRCTGYMGQRRAIESLCQEYQQDLLASEDRESYLIEKNILPAYSSMSTELMPSKNNPEASQQLVAGGTDLYLEQNIERLSGGLLIPTVNTPAVIVSNERISLSAKHSIYELEVELGKLGLLPSFNSFAENFASPLVRRRATLGGNLAHASPVADGICYLMGLKAELETNQRRIAIKDFYTGFKQTSLEADEVIEWLHVPKPADNSFVFFEKVGRRKTCDIAVMNCCGLWVVENGLVSSVSLVMGGATTIPVRLRKLEGKLTGLPLWGEFPPGLFDELDSSISPISDVRGSDRYRRILAKQLLVSQWYALLESFQVLEGQS